MPQTPDNIQHYLLNMPMAPSPRRRRRRLNDIQPRNLDESFRNESIPSIGEIYRELYPTEAIKLLTRSSQKSPKIPTRVPYMDCPDDNDPDVVSYIEQSLGYFRVPKVPGAFHTMDYGMDDADRRQGRRNTVAKRPIIAQILSSFPSASSSQPKATDAEWELARYINNSGGDPYHISSKDIQRATQRRSSSRSSGDIMPEVRMVNRYDPNIPRAYFTMGRTCCGISRAVDDILVQPLGYNSSFGSKRGKSKAKPVGKSKAKNCRYPYSISGNRIKAAYTNEQSLELLRQAEQARINCQNWDYTVNPFSLIGKAYGINKSRFSSKPTKTKPTKPTKTKPTKTKPTKPTKTKPTKPTKSKTKKKLKK